MKNVCFKAKIFEKMTAPLTIICVGIYIYIIVVGGLRGVLNERRDRPAIDIGRSRGRAFFATVGKIRALRVDYNYAGKREKILQLHFSNSKRLTATVKRVYVQPGARAR
jgi:hypothetical protein